MSFAKLGLSDSLLRAVEEQGYDSPTPIQQQAIPAVLSGRDVMAAAQTGTGKTAGFTLPLLQRLAPFTKGSSTPRALVLTPTRELAAQVGESVAVYGKHLQVRSAVVFGGVKINPQIQTLQKGVEVLIATPGRLLDLHSQGAVSFDALEILVLDEADRMLDMGFIHDIRKILRLLPAERQNLLFSATFSKEIKKLTEGILDNPVSVSVSPPNATANTVRQKIYTVDKKRKPDLLIHLIKEGNWNQVLVFSRTKHGANRLAEKLCKSGIEAAAIHGNKSQNARTKALAAFKHNKIQVLVATDIAARGLDIDQLPHVVNVDLPNVPEDYVHRIGRTGRAGSNGEAISLVSADEVDQLAAIERLIRNKLPRDEVDGFETNHTVPDTGDISRPARKPRKPSKPGGGKPQGRPGGGKPNSSGSKRRSGGGNRSAKPSGSQRQNSGGGNQSKPAGSKPSKPGSGRQGRPGAGKQPGKSSSPKPHRAK